MRLIGILVALVVVGWLVKSQLASVSKLPTVPGVPLGVASQPQTPRDAVNAVGAAATQALQQGAEATADKLKEAEEKAAGK